MCELEPEMWTCPHCGFSEGNSPQPGYALRRNTVLEGRYLVGNVLGQGGFGITYMGWDSRLDIKVAIKEYYPMGKVFRNHSSSNEIQWDSACFNEQRQWEEGKEDFLKEARRAAQLGAVPGIVKVQDCFPENETMYIVMNYAEGRTLKSYLMEKGTMEYSQCIRMMEPLFEGLDMIHQQGIIHRDIKPDNIMVQPDGSLLILDLGAAVDIKTDQGRTSLLVATPGFGAPEQYIGSAQIGSWTDVYAVCATIYYCITGKVPPDAMERLMKKTEEITFEGMPQKALSAAAVQTLRQGMEPDREDRIRDMGQLRKMLRKTVPKSEGPSLDKAAHTIRNFTFQMREKQEERKREKEKEKKKLKGWKRAVRTVKNAAMAFFLILGIFLFVIVLQVFWESDPDEVYIQGCSNANLDHASFYNSIEGEYDYYIDRDQRLYVSPPTEIGANGSSLVDDGKSACFNTGADKVYYLHCGSQDSGWEKTSLVQMDMDGGNPEIIYSGGTLDNLLYVQYTENGREVLYYIERAQKGAGPLFRYDLGTGKAEKIVEENIIWYNVYEKYLYYIAETPGTTAKGHILKRALLNGKNPEVLDEENDFTRGYIEEGTAFLCSESQKAMIPCNLDGSPYAASSDPEERRKYEGLEKYGEEIYGCNVYGDGRIYYLASDGKKICRIRTDGQEYEEIFEGYEVLDLSYANSYLWAAVGRIEDGSIADIQQTFLISGDGSQVVSIDGGIGNGIIQAGLEYEMDEKKQELRVTGYSGEDKNVIIPAELNGTEIKDVVFDSMPMGLIYYYMLHEDELSYEKTEDQEGAVLTGYDGSVTGEKKHLVLPETIDGLPVTELGEELFKEKDIEGIILPSGLNRIGASAFQDCTELSYVELGDDLKTIGPNAFSSCSSMKNIELPEGLEEIELGAFLFTEIEDVKFPASLSSIEYSFTGESYEVAEGNTSYTVIDGVLFTADKKELVMFPSERTGTYTIPESCESIGLFAFSASGLSKLIIPESVERLGNGAFSFMWDIKEIRFPDGLEEIPDAICRTVKSLQKVIIPESVRIIGEEAFYGCGLTEVTVSKECEVDDTAFDEGVSIGYYE